MTTYYIVKTSDNLLTFDMSVNSSSDDIGSFESENTLNGSLQSDAYSFLISKGYSGEIILSYSL